MRWASSACWPREPRPAAGGHAGRGWRQVLDGRGLQAGDRATGDFIYDRLAGSLREQGYTAQEVDAVVSQRPQRLGDIPKRLAAVRAFSALPEAAALAAANKRVGNILKKVEDPGRATVDSALLKEAAEIALHDALVEVVPQADAAFVTGDYTESLQALAACAPVDAFFDGVMVNADDPALRANRLGLLAKLHAAMNQVADMSKLSAEPEPHATKLVILDRDGVINFDSAQFIKSPGMEADSRQPGGHRPPQPGGYRWSWRPTSPASGAACSTWIRSTPSTRRCTRPWRSAGDRRHLLLPAGRLEMRLPQAQARHVQAHFGNAQRRPQGRAGIGDSLRDLQACACRAASRCWS
jgi:hypothetical protein